MKDEACDNIEWSYVGGALFWRVQTRTEESLEAEIMVEGLGKDTPRT
jgi:hypothetical protein